MSGVPRLGVRADITDSLRKAASIRGTSAPPGKRNVMPPSGAGGLNGNSAGAADEELFMQSFEDPLQVPRIELFSVKDLEAELAKFATVCSNPAVDWEKRTDSLRRLRSLVIAGALSYPEFIPSLRTLQDPFLMSIKDLRSQVVREACITVAYLSLKAENKCDKLMEVLLPDLINQIQSSAKIMSSSAEVAIRFIIQHTHCPRFIRIITAHLSSKNKKIRRVCCEFLGQLLHTWSARTLEKNVDLLKKAIQQGISDADPDARVLSRKAFWAFNAKFKAESDKLLSTLDANKQKMLSDERMSNWSSTSSLNRVPMSMTCTVGRPPLSSRQANSVNGSMESLNTKFGVVPRRIPPPSASKPAFRTPAPRQPVTNYERRLSNTSCSRSTASAKRSSISRTLSHSDERQIVKQLLHVTPRKKCNMDDQNDEASESSSICSDMSFSAYNCVRLESTERIIEKLRSQVWSHRKEGLANLLAVFRESQSCRELDSVQLKEISDVLHRMLNDKQVKSHSLVLNVVNEFIQIYSKQLDYWLYPLMTRLFVRLSSDILLNSLHTRIVKTLEHIRECFPIVLQFNSIMKLISDTRYSFQYQTKIMQLEHLSKIIFRMDAIDFTYDKVNNQEIVATIKKVLDMSSHPKSGEHKKICDETIINLHHLNNTQMTLYINSLEPMYQEAARQIIDSSQERRETHRKALPPTPFLIQATKDEVKNVPFEESHILSVSRSNGTGGSFVQSSILSDSIDTGKGVPFEEAPILTLSTHDPMLAFNTLKEYINSEDRLLSTKALNILLKVVELNKERVPELMPEMIPCLLKAYDSNETQVRKSTVFCLVAIHGAIGDELYSHLNSLVQNKLSRLVQFYVERPPKANPSS